MKMSKLRYVLCALLMSAAGGASAADDTGLADMVANYQLSRGSLTLGEAQFRLSPHGEPGCYRYEYEAKPTGLARIFIGELHERSDFCVVDGELLSQRFEFTRADKPKDNFTLDFDWDKRVVKSSKGEMRDLTKGMIDRLLMQLAVQRWVVQQEGKPGPAEYSLTKVEDDRIKTYRFRIVDKETLEVPAGKFDTLRIERVDDPKKSTRFWVVPSREYMLVRVEQTKSGSEQVKMELK